jgi:hypothetical protein
LAVGTIVTIFVYFGFTTATLVGFFTYNYLIFVGYNEPKLVVPPKLVAGLLGCLVKELLLPIPLPKIPLPLLLPLPPNIGVYIFF